MFVLILLTLLSLMAATFSHSMRNDAALISNQKNHIESRALMDAGLAYTKLMLSQPDLDQRWQADGREYIVSIGERELRVSIYDEAGKFDLNRIDRELLWTLVKSTVETTSEADRLVDCILDWRDADDDERPNGAELSVASNVGYYPGNRAFQSVRELKRVWGMTDEVFERLSPVLTVQTRQNKVDIGMAMPQTLRILPGAGPIWVEQVLEARGLDADQVAQLSIPDGMNQYAVLRSPQRAISYRVRVSYALPDGDFMRSEVLIRRNAHDVFPIFTEIERSLTRETASVISVTGSSS